MLTSEEILNAAEEVANTTPQTKLEEFCGVSSETLEEVLNASSYEMTPEEEVWFVSGIVVALRAKQVQSGE